jgi:hypothetical protein
MKSSTIIFLLLAEESSFTAKGNVMTAAWSRFEPTARVVLQSCRKLQIENSLSYRARTDSRGQLNIQHNDHQGLCPPRVNSCSKKLTTAFHPVLKLKMVEMYSPPQQASMARCEVKHMSTSNGADHSGRAV